MKFPAGKKNKAIAVSTAASADVASSSNSKKKSSDAQAQEEVLAVNHQLLIMQRIMQGSSKDTLMVAGSAVTAAISGLVFPKSALGRAKQLGLNNIGTWLMVGGTTGTNTLLNFFFLLDFAQRKTVATVLSQLTVDKTPLNTPETSWVITAAKLLGATGAATPFALLSMDSILPHEYDNAMFLVQLVVYMTLNDFSVEQILKTLNSMFTKSSNLDDIKKHSKDLLDALDSRIYKLETVLKTKALQGCPTLENMRGNLLTLHQDLPGKGITKDNQTAMKNITHEFLTSETIREINDKKTISNTWPMVATGVVIMVIAAYTLLGYANVTEEDLEERWGLDLAITYTAVAMTIFACLMCSFTKTVFNTVSDMSYQMYSDAGQLIRKNGPSVIEFFKQHLLTYPMYNMPISTFLLLIPGYIMGFNSSGTSQYLQEEAMERFDLTNPQWIADASVLATKVITVVFNTFVMPIVVTALLSKILRSHHPEKNAALFETLLLMWKQTVAESRGAGAENSLFLINRWLEDAADVATTINEDPEKAAPFVDRTAFKKELLTILLPNYTEDNINAVLRNLKAANPSYKTKQKATAKPKAGCCFGLFGGKGEEGLSLIVGTSPKKESMDVEDYGGINRP